MEVALPPKGLEREFETVFSAEAQRFLEELFTEFQQAGSKLLLDRKVRKLHFEANPNALPSFDTPAGLCVGDWKIAPLPPRLQNRKLDLGDVDSSNDDHFKRALSAQVEGVQVDFDDGFCPTWGNIIKGHYNIIQFVSGTFYPNEVPSLDKAPILMLRPRAWNMTEHNVVLNGREVPGPLVDFGLLMFHIGLKLKAAQVGPFFYLSKLEGASEAKLWDQIFSWAEDKVGLQQGTIKACVLIENIFAAFEMDQILFALKDHSIGLNCGIWDYCASFLNKLGTRRSFLIPDRCKYVSMDKPFLKAYMQLVIQTCHKRGALATGGMAALLTSSNNMGQVSKAVCAAKAEEIQAGIDGFLVYDTKLVAPLRTLWNSSLLVTSPNQMHRTLDDVAVTAANLLEIPPGGVTMYGLKRNVKVGIMFIFSWLHDGRGHFSLYGAVEDSATAEISRSQVWQWIYHGVALEDEDRPVITKSLIMSLADQVLEEEKLRISNGGDEGQKEIDIGVLDLAKQVFMEIVTAPEVAEFITTFLYNHSLFRKLQQT